VVLVDFWTYSCINCIRTFPHVQGWWDRYQDHGLVVVGVHTPEFRFERDAANVQAAALRHNLTYPIAQDNDYSVWGAYHNRYWPAKYLVDAYGRVRHTHFGEGAYLETEHVLRQLLVEAGNGPLPAWVEQQEPQGPGRVDLTPELYAAAAQGLGRVAIGNPEGYHPGQTIAYAPPASVPRDRIFLEGTWHNEEEFVQSAGEGSVLVRFRAADAVLVAAGAEGACIPVRLDGGPVPEASAGRDVQRRDGATCLPLDGARSYQFYAGPLEEHLVELQVPAGFQLFTFAFSSTGRT
jgi:thiol-disulfide isomerase/thioredoxin